MPSWPLLDNALNSGRFTYALRIAKTWPGPLPLKESARLLYLAASAEDGADDEWYQRAALRWLGRLATEVKGITLKDARLAVDALDALDGTPEALDTLTLLAQPRRT